MQKLDNDSINSIINEIQHFLSIEGVDKRNISIVRIIAEDVLLFYQNALSSKAEFEYQSHRKNNIISCVFRVKGEKTDILTGAHSDELPLVFRLIKKLNGTLSYSYENDENLIEITLIDKITFRGNLAFAWEMAKVKKKEFIFATILQVLSTVICIQVPIYTVKIITGLSMPVTGELFVTAAIVLLMRFVNAIIYRESLIRFARVYDKALYILQDRLADAVLQTKQNVLQERGSGFFFQRIADDATSVATGLNDMIVNLVDFMYYFGIAVAMIVLSPVAFLASAANILLLYFLDKRRGRILTACSKKLRYDEEQVSDCVDAIVHGNEEIRLQNSQQYFREMLRNRVQVRNASAFDKTLKRQNCNLLNKECNVIGQFLYIVILALLLKNGILTFASAIALYNFNTTISQYIVSSLTDFLDSVKEYNIACERVGMLISSPFFPKEQFGSRKLDKLTGNIRFEHVYFAYNHENILETDRYVIKDMDLCIEAGKTTAIVGRSGYGKTTIVNLMTRIRDATEGRITLDGVDIRELDKDTLRSGIAVVSQNSYYYNMSIRDNLAIVNPNLSDDELMEICGMVSLEELVRGLPDGLDTVIGEQGMRLSGGQRQRLAIARVIAKNSPIIVFDEATSALDNITQQQVQNTISRLSGEHTVIVIAHRLSTIRNADKIVYIDDGKVLAEGTHEELWAKCAPYRTLYEAEDVVKE